MRTAILLLLSAPLLAAPKTPAPVVHGLQWTVSMSNGYTSYDALTYRAFLTNAKNEPVELVYEGTRPKVVLELDRVTGLGERTLKPLPAADLVTRGNPVLRPGAKREISVSAAPAGIHRWLVSCSQPAGSGVRAVQVISNAVLVKR